MTTERELAHQLRAACRRLHRYNGIDKKRTDNAMDEIDEILAEWEYLEDNDELDKG